MKDGLPVHYHRKETTFSDHRPVLAIYKMQVVKTDANKKDALKEIIAGKLMSNGTVTKQSMEQLKEQYDPIIMATSIG